MNIVAIDPGPTQSAIATINHLGRLSGAIHQNRSIIHEIPFPVYGDTILAIEQIRCYGMPVGAEVLDTCVWTGRFYERLVRFGLREDRIILIPRKEVAVHLCGSAKGNDSTIRQALIDRYGKPGTKKAPGGTYGFAHDMWAALAVATVAADRYKAGMLAVRP